jgi:hypothetical protein
MSSGLNRKPAALQKTTDPLFLDELESLVMEFFADLLQMLPPNVFIGEL